MRTDIAVVFSTNFANKNSNAVINITHKEQSPLKQI